METDAFRSHAREILDAGVRAVDPEALVRVYLSADQEEVARLTRVHVLSVGKAAVAMARGATGVLGDRVVSGMLIAPPGTDGEEPAGFEVFRGGHPIPDATGVAGARAVLDLASSLDEADQLLCLISGGGSALMTLPPPGIPLEDIQTTTSAVLRAGATIEDLNCVRKHLDQLKGGRLARVAAPARVLALLLSDVVGDSVDVIASGPLSPDPTTFSDALEVLARFEVLDAIPASVKGHLEDGVGNSAAESPKADAACFARVETVVVGSNRLAVAGAAVKAESLGYAVETLTTSLTGEARTVGHALAREGLERLNRDDTDGAFCLIAGGETTVTVRGSGKGGCNQELALGGAVVLEGHAGIAIASMGTDGIDGPTDAAGAFADGDTVRRAAAVGLEAERTFTANDSYAFFQALDDHIVTGPTGTNVMDLAIVLGRRPEPI